MQLLHGIEIDDCPNLINKLVHVTNLVGAVQLIPHFHSLTSPDTNRDLFISSAVS
jgi:hypothetical protein